MGYRTFEHNITAGQQFTGAAPGGAVTNANGIESAAASNAGGLFDFGQEQVIELHQVNIKLGAQASWILAVLHPDTTTTPIATGTNETVFFRTAWGLLLFKGDKIKLTTVGASGAMKARVTRKT